MSSGLSPHLVPLTVPPVPPEPGPPAQGCNEGCSPDSKVTWERAREVLGGVRSWHQGARSSGLSGPGLGWVSSTCE